ncbi:MAG: glycoside hydrolase family 3 C-terminal domain-containing protein, partial [Chloroflexota bacterium]
TTGVARGAAGYVPGIPRMGFPPLYLVDGSVGVGNATGESTALPSALASAATWDLELAYRYGVVLGKDMRAHGVNVHLGGNVNLVGREPRNGRAFETKGEDPILAGRINAAHLRGTQDQNVVACIKHFALNDQETDRTMASVIIDERAARETDLLAFEIGVKDAGVQSVMAGYNLVSGAWCSENDALLDGVLKQDWGFAGFVLSDWYGTHSCAPAAMAGLDMEMPGSAFFGGMRAAIESGLVPQARLDDMVHRIVRAVFAVGLYDHPTSPGTVDAEANLAVARAVAEQGTVLLRNEGQLPLSPGVRSIAVIGPHADVGVIAGGGSADVVPIGGSALVERSSVMGSIFPVRWLPSSPLAAIRAKAPGATVRFLDGASAAEAAALAAQSEVVIVFAAQWSVEALDRPDLGLVDLVHPASPLDQDALIRAVASANPRTIVVLEGPGAQAMPWLSSVGAVLAAWYPGQRGAEAIAGILFGDVNPSGKLPITFPRNSADLPRPTIGSGTTPFDVRYDEGLRTGYRWFDAQAIEPLFPFGFGLSYTTFTLSGATVSLASGDQLTVTVDLANTGARSGAEVVQVYLSMPASLGEPPRRLVGWKKVTLAAGAREKVTIVVDGNSSAHPLGYWDTATRSWSIAPGEYGVYVGNSSRSLSLAGTVRR